MKVTPEIKAALRQHGVENFLTANAANISDHAQFEPPCGVKWLSLMGKIRVGAFSYGVSGYVQDAFIGRYVSMGENIQIGRANHALDWVSTSPFFYLNDKMFDVGRNFPTAKNITSSSAIVSSGCSSDYDQDYRDRQ